MAKKKAETDFDAPIGAPDVRLWEKEGMTIDEWVSRMSVSLRYYLKQSCWPTSNDSEVHHPEDLAANSGAFLDAMSHIFGEFGVRPK